MPTNTKKLVTELARFTASVAALETPQGREAALAALRSGGAPLAAQAAKAIAEHKPSGFEDMLVEAYELFAGERATTIDPGCVAKEAIVAALDALEHLNAELFAEASVYVQPEKIKGTLRDTAASVRARGVLGVARLGHPDALAIFGACLGDRDPTVRLSAARAIGHREQRDGAGLLLLRLGAGDDAPEVSTECVRSLFAVAPDLGTRYARTELRNADPELRERLLHVLGTASHDGAVALLAEELAATSLGNDRRTIIEALGLSRRPNARELLLELVHSERRSDAEAAITALAIHRYDDRLVHRVRELTEHSRELSQLYREHFLP